VSQKSSADIAHVTLRIRESLRKKLAAEAEYRHWSLNNEIRWRLEESLEQRDMLTLTDCASQILNSTSRLQAQLKEREQAEERARVERDRLGEVIRAAEALVKAVERNDADDVKDATSRIRGIINTLETEAKVALRHPRGGKS